MPMRISIAVLLCILFGVHSASFARLHNYENDPDLEKAIRYDRELNDGRSGSQELAEKYYLAYLEKCEESSQRAKVYVQLGVLFSTNVDKANGEKRDQEKCIAYFNKALEEEPERVGKETYRARSFLTSYASSGADRVRARMDLYEWLLNVEKAKDVEWLPETPQRPASQRDIDRITSLFKSSRSVTARNMTYEASESLNSEMRLQEIIDRFPGSYAEDEAKRYLEANVKEKLKSKGDDISDAALIAQIDTVKTPMPTPLQAIRTPTPSLETTPETTQANETKKKKPWMIIRWWNWFASSVF